LRLSMPALETLAVIAYKQPVTAPEISDIRSVNTSGVISTLLDKKLITTAGRKEVMGRPILYKTSKEFLMRFGLSDLEELPSLKEFEALAREALGSDEGFAPSGNDFRESEALGGVASEGAASGEHAHGSVTEAVAQVQEELAEAEAFREHEALATAEGMPSGELEEEPPAPAVKLPKMAAAGE
jgi:segregation and condensation protein B